MLSSKEASTMSAASTNDLATMISTEMEKQCDHIKEDMAALMVPIQAFIATFQEMVDTLGKRFTSVETTAVKNLKT